MLTVNKLSLTTIALLGLGGVNGNLGRPGSRPFFAERVESPTRNMVRDSRAGPERNRCPKAPRTGKLYHK